MSGELPPGFTLDQPGGGAELPHGFTLDAPASASAAQPATAEEPTRWWDYVPAVPVAETALHMGSGMVGSALGGLTGLLSEPGAGADVSRRIQDRLTYEPRTKSGKAMTEAVSLPGRAVSYVADKVGERGAEVSPELATIGKTSVEALPLLLGARSATKPAKPLTTTQKGAAASRDAGFTLTPEEMGAGPVARTAGTLAGEPRLARGISNKNQPVIVEKLSADLNIPKGMTLDLDTLKGVLKREHQAYQNVRGTGQVTASPQYTADLNALEAKYANVARDFPELAQADVQSVINGARRPAFDANSAVDLISQLRQSASDAFAGRQAGLGKVYRGVADAVEAELGRHVQAIGRPELYRQFTEARTRIAQTHLLEDALLSPDQVNPRVYAEAARDGAPLTGGAKKVGQFAARSERSAMKPSNIGTGATLGDVFLAGINGLRTQGGSLVLDALTAGVRPAMRSFIGSRPGQFLMDPRTRIASPAVQAAGIGSVPRFQEETE